MAMHEGNHKLYLQWSFFALFSLWFIYLFRQRWTRVLLLRMPTATFTLRSATNVSESGSSLYSHQAILTAITTWEGCCMSWDGLRSHSVEIYIWTTALKLNSLSFSVNAPLGFNKLQRQQRFIINSRSYTEYFTAHCLLFVDINDCKPGYCINGVCDDRILRPHCNCTLGYRGDRCEHGNITRMFTHKEVQP